MHCGTSLSCSALWELYFLSHACLGLNSQKPLGSLTGSQSLIFPSTWGSLFFWEIGGMRFNGNVRIPLIYTIEMSLSHSFQCFWFKFDVSGTTPFSRMLLVVKQKPIWVSALHTSTAVHS